MINRLNYRLSTEVITKDVENFDLLSGVTSLRAGELVDATQWDGVTPGRIKALLSVT
jgi:hypothetical protein